MEKMTEVAIVNCIEKMMTERREKILESDEYIRQDVDDLKELEEREAEKLEKEMETAGDKYIDLFFNLERGEENEENYRF